MSEDEQTTDSPINKDDDASNHLQVPDFRPKEDPGIIEEPIGDCDIHITECSVDQREYEQATRLLRHRLKIYFYAAVKYKDHICSFQAIYFIFMMLQILKVTLITVQMFSFGNDRIDFNNVVERGHLTLRHLLLKDWDASWETIPYPPAQGDFAVYDIANLKEDINYAVTNLFNTESEAIGYFEHLNETVMAEMTYFDFGGFHKDNSTSGLNIKNTAFEVNVEKNVGNATQEARYSYDIDKDFQRNNLSDPVKRLLAITVVFRIYSVRVDVNSSKARCLSVDGWVTFKDLDNNGQVLKGLDTLTKRIKCAEMGFDVHDRELETVDMGLSVIVIIVVIISLAYTVASMVFGGFVLVETKRYMKKYFRKFYDLEDLSEKDLTFYEYLRFFKGWDLIVFAGDLLTIIGTFGMVLELKDAVWTVASLELYAVILGIGCILQWVGLLRYLKFNYKFHLLFNTLYNSVWDVLAYLLCITVLYVGYLSFGYVVIGPYHIKFATLNDAATTLFALINGDEIYATFAMLDAKKTGGSLLIPVIYKIYIGTYVAIFTIIVVNLLIALFTNAYDSIKDQYENPEVRQEGPLERTLKQLLTSDEEDSQIQYLKSTFYELMKGDVDNRKSMVENKLRTELRKTMRISEKKNKIVLKKPRTLKAFILDEVKQEMKPGKCCCVFACLRFWGPEGHCFC